MPKYLLDNTKKYISTIKPSEVKTLFEYFDNSSEFTLHSEKRGLEIPLNTDSVTYVDSEMDDRNYYKEYIANDGGFKSNVIDYFAIADVLTFPSYREGFPNVVMQAAAMQLNAIVSDINGCNEIISNGDNGWIVPPKNVEQLQERMEWCMTNREESKDMGRKSRAVMEEKYERTYVWGEILKEYNKQLEAIPYVKK